ncbi:hypothetical protein GO003_009310 [Methylicorpusculum oleiharenae]|uniref:hypothetical protein n=1 Tax=Methylicorpusculum oleiharenae TaxID=1338687 RepID=UPI00135785F2|nr:hypothetical protein [Methylicorpusculum oleiharenae]MCD2450586.1 hypothetical protein [Methylicorpusculum oleiharenae]
MRFAEVWVAILCATAMLYAADLFVIYLKDFAMMNAVYGAFGGIMVFCCGFTFSGAFSSSALVCALLKPKNV